MSVATPMSASVMPAMTAANLRFSALNSVAKKTIQSTVKKSGIHARVIRVPTRNPVIVHRLRGGSVEDRSGVGPLAVREKGLDWPSIGEVLISPHLRSILESPVLPTL